MIKSYLKWISVAISIALAAFCVYVLVSPQNGASKATGGSDEGGAEESADRRDAASKSRKGRQKDKSAKRNGKGAALEGKVSGAKEEKEPPNLDDLDEKELSTLQKAILKELKLALKENDLEGVRKAIARFHAPKPVAGLATHKGKDLEGGLGGEVPKVLRQYAVTALGWFGGSAIGDMLEFMADIDPEVEQEAFTQFELILDDWDVSDRERASALLTVLKALHDPERIDSLLMSLNNMRNSVKGDTMIRILNSGTTEAQMVLQEQIEFFTDFDIVDAGGISNWMKNNPDNEWDDDFYGGEKK